MGMEKGSACVILCLGNVGARILAVLRENRHYDLRDTHDQPIDKKGAMELVQSEYKVPELIRQVRRRRKLNQVRLTSLRTREAAKVPQSGPTHTSPNTVYSAEEVESIAN